MYVPSNSIICRVISRNWDRVSYRPASTLLRGLCISLTHYVSPISPIYSLASILTKRQRSSQVSSTLSYRFVLICCISLTLSITKHPIYTEFYRIDSEVVNSVADQLWTKVCSRFPFTDTNKGFRLHLQSPVSPSNSQVHNVSMQLKVDYRLPLAEE